VLRCRRIGSLAWPEQLVWIYASMRPSRSLARLPSASSALPLKAPAMNAPTSTLCHRFGLFELNVQTGELHKQGVNVKVGRQACKILALLLENPGQLRTREEIRQQLWGMDTFVNFDQSLNKAIHQLREVLGDPASNPRYIETVPGRGYRFVYLAQESNQGNQNPTAKPRTVAVLPFATNPDSREMDLLSKRIVEAVIDEISRSRKIRVLAYSTVQHYRTKEINLHKLGENLLVRVVAVGEMIRPNDHLLLHVELVDAHDGTQLWGAQFKERYADVLAGPETLASKICNQLRPILAQKKGRKRGKRSKRAA
jgi:DNA-binding winged helix-turn-helix (wHTH) protein